MTTEIDENINVPRLLLKLRNEVATELKKELG